MTAAPNPGRATATVASVERQRRARRARWLFVLALAGLFAAWQASLEIARWQLAAALNLRADGQKAAASQLLATVANRFPNSPLLLLQRAEWRLEDGQRDEAMADCDRMLELAGDRPNWLMVHSQFFQNAAEFSRAVEDWKKINEFSKRSGIPDRPEALNGLAYAQALASQELEDALNSANEALELRPESNPHILDTRGFIYHRMGKNILALSDLNRAADALNPLLAQLGRTSPQARRPQSPFEHLTASLPKTWLEAHPSGLTAEQEMALRARTVAVIHYHRALVLEALDRHQEAEQDKAVVRRLIGRDGDETLF